MAGAQGRPPAPVSFPIHIQAALKPCPICSAARAGGPDQATVDGECSTMKALWGEEPRPVRFPRGVQKHLGDELTEVPAGEKPSDSRPPSKRARTAASEPSQNQAAEQSKKRPAAREPAGLEHPPKQRLSDAPTPAHGPVPHQGPEKSFRMPVTNRSMASRPPLPVPLAMPATTHEIVPGAMGAMASARASSLRALGVIYF